MAGQMTERTSEKQNLAGVISKIGVAKGGKLEVTLFKGVEFDNGLCEAPTTHNMDMEGYVTTEKMSDETGFKVNGYFVEYQERGDDRPSRIIMVSTWLKDEPGDHKAPWYVEVGCVKKINDDNVHKKL